MHRAARAPLAALCCLRVLMHILKYSRDIGVNFILALSSSGAAHICKHCFEYLNISGTSMMSMNEDFVGAVNILKRFYE